MRSRVVALTGVALLAAATVLVATGRTREGFAVWPGGLVLTLVWARATIGEHERWFHDLFH